ncbi:hypothetical protein Z517_11790 [Fonsecaea pedrosoi CBS 271.37]|uniref:Uncharacterized protein n=1 Tax=Fonsecaea pedrosoi CBS 271.37 TaxID=1442368 RepID=A0A0D2GRJ2_9EURO|nr:uncharacterized protein Z517_11790 [Fonsecaea pedrosoi CBS 271.37]KIW75019.1 hypothetical protein Z517_11790 [Fonsecaea pedrosoi CBS 271.37]
MPEPENTPAPTRRFLPPSTSSSAKTTVPFSVRRNPFQSSRSTQPPSATPSSFAATPRFQRATPTVRDDIQINFDDDDEVDSAISSKDRLIATTSGGDILDFDDDETHPTLSPLYSRGVRVAEDVEEDDHDPGNEPSSPLQHRLRDPGPVTKRRKVSHHGTNVSAAPIAISSSSPEHHGLDETSFQIDADSPTSLSDLDDDDSGPPRRPTAAFNDSSSRIPRFRPIPTSTRGLTLHSPVVSRTVFKPPGPDDPVARASTGSGSGPVLPDIFSPSRRRGKRDYLPGGSASLVRSWVLDIATRESHAESLAEETLRVAQVEKDASGRFVLVSDDQGHRWLLPEQQHERPGSDGGGGGSRRSSLDHWSSAVSPGSCILIKGKATRWTLDLESQGLGDVVVAAYWEPTTSPG